MRRIVIGSLAVLLAVIVGLPAAVGLIGGRVPAAKSQPAPGAATALNDGSDQLKISVYFPDTRKVEELALGDYLVGVVAAEMPAGFPDEALKAQFVVARTYAVRRMHQFTGKRGCSLSPTADICADPGTGQAFISKADYSGEKGAAEADRVWQHLTELQAATRGQVLRYQGQFIDPLYHAVSGTATEDSGSYFAEALPYLKSVDDHWGAIVPNLKAVERRTPEALSKALAAAGKQAAVSALASSVKAGQVPVEVVARTGSGRVQTVKVLGLTITGRELREALGLPSANFTVAVEQGAVAFHTTGKGHGVGMSQWGANGMAREGKSYQDILSHYYTGVTLSTIFAE